MTLTVGSLFAGIGGFDLGFQRAGLSPLWHCEKDANAQRVMFHHWPECELIQDVRDVDAKRQPTVDVICGGFPCQDLSIAGKRAGLDGERSGLWWEMLRVITQFRPRLVVWENVPGLGSSDERRDIVRVVSSLAKHNYFGCVRTLDAQHFGVPQRRRRLFGVFAPGRAGAGLAAEILSLAESVPGHSSPGREAGKDVAGTLGGGTAGRGWSDDLDRAGAFVPALAGSLRASQCRKGEKVDNIIAATLRSRTSVAGGGMAVRRLMPVECCRLQGFPDDWLDLEPPLSDSAKYRLLGNAVPVPVAEWIGRRIYHTLGCTRLAA